MKTTVNTIANSMRTLIVALIVVTALSGFAKGANENSKNLTGTESAEISIAHQELANQMESWINDGNYWSNETESDDQELALQMKSWMENGAFWSVAPINHEEEMADQMVAWVQTSAFWSNEDENDEQELAQKMEAWLSNTTYWNNLEAQNLSGIELAVK